MRFDCVLNFIITSKSREGVIGYFSVTYSEGDMQITSKNMQWSSTMSRFPPSLNEYCVEIDSKKVCPKRIRIWERAVKYEEVTEDYTNE